MHDPGQDGGLASAPVACSMSGPLALGTGEESPLIVSDIPQQTGFVTESVAMREDARYGRQMRPPYILLLLSPLVACAVEDTDQPNAAGFLPEADAEVATGGAGPCAVDLGDLDGDGDLDIAVSHLFSRSATMLLNDGAGRFTGSWVEWPQLAPMVFDGEGGVIDIADIDGDQAQDILVTSGDSNELVVLINPSNRFGDGVFTMSTVAVGEFPFGVVAADLDANQGLDVAVSNGESDDVWVLPGQGDGQFGPAQVYPSGGVEPGFVRAADMDGDGRNDLITSNHTSGEATVLMNNGAGFSPAEVYAAGSGPSAPTPFDLDGDGDLDLMTANEGDETMTVFLNAGDGILAERGRIAPDGIPFYIQPIDLDGDGDLDIAVPIEDQAVVAFFENDGTGAFEEIARSDVASSPASMAAGDLDGDGDTDLVVTNFFSDTVSVLVAQPAE